MIKIAIVFVIVATQLADHHIHYEHSPAKVLSVPSLRWVDD